MWGRNSDGRLGDGTTEDRLSPVWVMDDVKYVSLGSHHTMAIKNDGTLWAWGSNNAGQLGNGTSTWLPNPEPVLIMENVIAVSAGVVHTMAIKNNFDLYTWGGNETGKLGNGSWNWGANPNPARVLTDVIAVSAGDTHSMAIRGDNSLWTWGRNHTGALGNGRVSEGQRGTTADHTPAKIMEDAAAITAGGGFSFVINTGGNLYAFGDNVTGQLGDGTTEQRTQAVRIMEDVRAISAGGGFAMALKNDGTLWTWGNNRNGRLGDGTDIQRRTPVRILDKPEGVITVSLGSGELTPPFGEIKVPLMIYVENVSLPWNLQLVNRYNALPGNFSIELETLPCGILFDTRAAEAMIAMTDAMKAEGLTPHVRSGYRSMATQTTFFTNRVNQYLSQGLSRAEAEDRASQAIAYPGTSEHNLGLGADIVCITHRNPHPLTAQLANAPVGRWLAQNSWRYGFILRYPNDKQHITHVIFEPWHFRYVGIEVATVIFERGITLEEYVSERLQ
jgi:LAS superfamily LD-carboxypeptidase LdcB